MILSTLCALSTTVVHWHQNSRNSSQKNVTFPIGSSALYTVPSMPPPIRFAWEKLLVNCWRDAMVKDLTEFGVLLECPVMVAGAKIGFTVTLSTERNGGGGGGGGGARISTSNTVISISWSSLYFEIEVIVFIFFFPASGFICKSFPCPMGGLKPASLWPAHKPPRINCQEKRETLNKKTNNKEKMSLCSTMSVLFVKSRKFTNFFFNLPGWLTFWDIPKWKGLTMRDWGCTYQNQIRTIREQDEKGLKMKIPFSIGLYNFENDSSILGCTLV